MEKLEENTDHSTDKKEPPQQEKKPYEKPILEKHDQLHKIGVGY